jgi:hypothetical protein
MLFEGSRWQYYKLPASTSTGVSDSIDIQIGNEAGRHAGEV